MPLLIDENVPNAVAAFFAERGHDVQFVRELLPAGAPDLVIAAIGDRHSLIVVTWDRDFDRLIARVPKGNVSRFRRLGRISFRCKEAQGLALLQRWIRHIEFHYEEALEEEHFRMILEVQASGIKIM
jgi:predicted nuclease of predicted toxin-antitoxin system